MDFEYENSDTEIGAADIQYTDYGIVCATAQSVYLMRNTMTNNIPGNHTIALYVY